MSSWQFVTRRMLPVLWPADWRITTTPAGLYLVEGSEADGWRLQGLFFWLGEALAFGEGLHSAPDRFGLVRPALPEQYRVSTEDGWRGRRYRSAIEENPFSLDPNGADWSGSDPLSIEGVALFVAARFRAVGRLSGAIEPEAVLALARHSGGIRRDLWLLAAAAALLADLECSPRLTPRHVEEAAAVARVPIQKSLPARSPLVSRSVVRSAVRRGMPAFAALSGLAFVGATSWTAQWVSREAATAQVASGFFAARSAHAPSTPKLLEARRAPEPLPALRHEDPAAVEEAVGGSFDSDVVAGAEELPEPPIPPAQIRSADRDDSVVPAAFSNALGSFKGPVSNQTLQLTGKLSIDISGGGVPGIVRAKFHAWDGLLGTGNLYGTLAADGRVTLSGLLLMGKNPFNCKLTGVIHGNHFTGTAQFVRPWGGTIAYSSFSLVRT